MLKLPFPFSVLAESMYIPSSYDEYHNVSKELLEKESFFYLAVCSEYHVLFSHASFQATHVKIAGGLKKSDLKQAKELGATWYRSKEQVPIKHNFVGDGYLSNKKWPLNEECTYHEVTVGNLNS